MTWLGLAVASLPLGIALGLAVLLLLRWSAEHSARRERQRRRSGADPWHVRRVVHRG